MAPPELRIEHVAIEKLSLDPANPRVMPESEMESLTRSIQKFGLVDPLIARRSDRLIIGGHQRLVAARRAGLTRVPVVFLDRLSDDEMHLLNIALNKISGRWDEQLLARLLSELEKSPDVDLSISGFSEDELSRYLKKLEAQAKQDQPETFDLETEWEAAQSNADIRPGDLYQLGDHRLMCGDASKAPLVASLLGDQKVTMAFTDPPYNVALGDHGGQQKGQRRRRIENDALAPEQWESFVRQWAGNLVPNVEGALYVCMSSKEWPLVARVLEESNAHWSDTLIWAKDRFVIGRADYQRQYEPIWYGWRDGARHHWCGGRDQGDVWNIPRPGASDLHPTMKPLQLVERAIKNSSTHGDSVLDLFLGSGTTLMAAERTGRICYGVELDPRYCQVIIRRWQSFTGRTAIKVEESR